MRAADAAGAGGIRACCADDSNANTGAEAQKSRAKTPYRVKRTDKL